MKSRTPNNVAFITLKFEQMFHRVMCPEYDDGLANNLIWFYTVCPDLSDN